MATDDEFFATREVDGVLVIVFRQSQILDAFTIDRMSSRLKELIDPEDHPSVVCDLSRVGYLSSSALGMLIGLQRRVTQGGGRLRLSGVRDEIMEVFKITKLDTVLDMYKDLPSAIDAFRKKR